MKSLALGKANKFLSNVLSSLFIWRNFEWVVLTNVLLILEVFIKFCTIYNCKTSVLEGFLMFSRGRERMHCCYITYERWFLEARNILYLNSYILCYFFNKTATSRHIKLTEAATGGVLWKKVILKVSEISQEITRVGSSTSGLQLY